MKTRKAYNLNDVVFEGYRSLLAMHGRAKPDENSTPYAENDDEESFDEIGSDGTSTTASRHTTNAANASNNSVPSSIGQSRKRKAVELSTSTSACQTWRRSPPVKKAPNKTNPMVKVAASARVLTRQGGSASVNLQAIVPHSQSSRTALVRITSGKACVFVQVQEPASAKTKKSTPSRLMFLFHGNLIRCDVFLHT
ncbi:hypothetical protein OsJ_35532 [Oryza sativa Japonica Group]|uniref:Uncharacterized protein n=1 Tax=Oryza sativa subsp. japonica TaxID=39947 RepID=B9GCB2_ORYSJ|nr:hypothetical protein OsJ_35532 [Oryza sativa Japonica Group]